MASILDCLHRNYQIVFPPVVPKNLNPIRIGILGAAKIAPNAIITPARTHPDVAVVAVAARSEAKAAAFAKKHAIPRVLASYADLVADPDIDAVYIPLPVSMHYEWAMRCLAAGKHVLLEKPATSNAAEAELLFGYRGGTASGTGEEPVLLEAAHYRFQPCWRLFLRLIDREGVERVEVRTGAPASMFADDDIRWQYELSGGALLDLGTYNISVLRGVFGREAEECLQCNVSTCPPPYELSDYKFDATFRFPNGGMGHIYGNMKQSLREMMKNYGTVEVWHRKKKVEDDTLPVGQEKTVTRKVTFKNFTIGAFWHSIVVEDDFEVVRTDSGQVVKRWTAKEIKKAYTFKDVPGMDHLPSKKYWLTYRYQLEEFVNAIRKKEGSGVWVSREDSIAQMKMIDMAYEKSGLPLRKTSGFRLGASA